MGMIDEPLQRLQDPFTEIVEGETKAKWIEINECHSMTRLSLSVSHKYGSCYDIVAMGWIREEDNQLRVYTLDVVLWTK